MNYRLFFFACTLNLFYYVPNLLATPIIGGHEDTDNTYKYHVSVQENYNPRIKSGEHVCGGAIIHDIYILSAAHCYLLKKANGEFELLLNPRSDGVVVLSGTSKTHGPGIVTPVVKIFIPRIFRANPTYADISVLKLGVSLNVADNEDKLQILRLDCGERSDFFVNKEALIVGQGCDTLVAGKDRVMRPTSTVADKRRYLEVYVFARNACPWFDNKICAINLDQSRIRTCCDGDSGSPMVYENTIIGVISRGPINCNNRGMLLSTRVSAFMYFIVNAMNEHGDHSQMHVLEN